MEAKAGNCPVPWDEPDLEADNLEEDEDEEECQAILAELCDEETWHYFFGDDDFEDVKYRQDPTRYGGFLESEWVMQRNYLTAEEEEKS